MIELLGTKIKLREATEAKHEDNSTESQLPDAIPSEPIEISTEVEVDSTIKDNAAAMMINDCIQRKWDDINTLKSLITTFDADKPTAYEEIINILNQLVDDETVAVGMLSKASELVDDSSAELMQKGIEKAEDAIEETKKADEESPVDESLITESEESPYDDYEVKMARRICKANGIEFAPDEYGSDAYWIVDSLTNLSDIRHIWDEFVKNCGNSALIAKFKKQYNIAEFTTIEDAFAEVSGKEKVFDDEGHFIDGIYDDYAQEVADKFFDGDIDELDEICTEEDCF